MLSATSFLEPPPPAGGWLRTGVCTDAYVAGSAYGVTDEERQQTVGCWAGLRSFLVLVYNPSADTAPVLTGGYLKC